jgi:hypothetical protein
MKKKHTQFYEANGYPFNRMKNAARKFGINEVQLIQGMEETFNDYVEMTGEKRPGRLGREIRIDIARNVFKKCETIERSQYRDIISKNKMLEKENVALTERWKFAVVLAAAGAVLVLIMKLFGVQSIL